MISNKATTVLRDVITVILTIVLIFPFFWILLASIRERDFFSAQLVFDFAMIHYYEILASKLPRQFINSGISVGFATILNVVLATVTAYAFSRYRFRGRKYLYFAVLITQVLPATAVIIPLYILWRDLGAFDNLIALGFAYSALTLAMGIMILKNFYDQIPREIDEAALIDGCGEFKRFSEVMLPLVLPAVAATAIFTFIISWQDFLISSSLIRKPEKFTANVGLYSMIGEYQTDWGKLLAGSILLGIPSIIIFSFLQRYFIQTLSGSVKG